MFLKKFQSLFGISTKAVLPRQISFLNFNAISFLKNKTSVSQEPKNALNKNQNQVLSEYSELQKQPKNPEANQPAQVTPPQQEEQPDESRLKEIETMHQYHKQLQNQVDSMIDIPFKLYGWLEIPEVKTAYVGERIFAESRLQKHVLLQHLYKIFQGSLYSMVEGDEEFLMEYCEKEFAQKILKNFQAYKDKGYKFKVEEDVSGIKGEPVDLFYYIIDMAVVRGLSVNRDENMSSKEYHKYIDIEDMGLVIYTPLELTNAKNFIDPEKNKTIYDPYKKMICRMLVYIKTPLRMKVYNPEGNQIQIDDNMYTWEHLAVFETQMIEPPKFKSFYKLENYMEWIGKFKFGTWKLVDIDNWVLGNPLIKDDPRRDLFKEEIFKGSKYDRETNIDIRNV